MLSKNKILKNFILFILILTAVLFVGIFSLTNYANPNCQNPDINKVFKNVQVQLCDGSWVYGNLDYCTQDGQSNCIASENYPSENINSIPYASKLETISLGGKKGLIKNIDIWNMANTAYPGAGFYSQIQGIPPIEKVCEGTYILKEEGQAKCNQNAEFNKLFPSTLSHDKGVVEIMSIYDEITNNIKTGYRPVPKIALDKFGSSSTVNVDKIIRNSISEWAAGVNKKVCGKSAQTIEDKIQNCKTHNPSVTPWDGATKGNSTEGTWTLVTVYSSLLNDGAICDSSCKEVWRDDRTGLLWSDTIVDETNSNNDAFNWCHASGSNNKSGSPYAEDDPSNYCDNATYQNQDNPISLCYEDSSWLTTPAWTYDDKGGLHLGSTPQVRWRLPTLYDWLLGLMNGAKWVLPNSDMLYWTATQVAYYTANQWLIWNNGDIWSTTRGNTQAGSPAQPLKVRCVGY